MISNIYGNIAEYLVSRPLFASFFGAAAGWGAAIASWVNLLHGIFALLGVIFGSVAAFIGMLIALRNYKNKQ